MAFSPTQSPIFKGQPPGSFPRKPKWPWGPQFCKKYPLGNPKNYLGLKGKNSRFFTVKAPLNGTISSVFINPGDLVNPGQPLFTIQNLNPCKVLVNVTSHDIASLKAGERAFIIKGNKKLECAITKIFPAAKSGMPPGNYWKSRPLEFSRPFWDFPARSFPFVVPNWDPKKWSALFILPTGCCFVSHWK